MAVNKPHEKVQRKTNKKFTFKKAVTKIKIDQSNVGKIEKLDDVAEEFMRVTQIYCNLLIATDDEKPDKNSDLPKIDTLLSARWQRCAWRQACGIVQSWFSNGRTNPPVLLTPSIQADTNIAELQKSNTDSFDFWIKLATLEKGHPVYLPVKLYKKAAETIEKYPCLFTGIKLEKADGVWYLTLVVGKGNKKGDANQVVGVDIGMKSMLVSSQDDHFGEISDKLRRRVERSKEKFARKQRLNACLEKKGLPPVDCADGRTERYVRNVAGREINEFLRTLPDDTAVAVERLNVKDMRFKSREMNRWMRASQLGFMLDRLKFKMDDAGIRYRSVQPAYTSQECEICGYVSRENRKTQEKFHCQNCGHTANADENASKVIAKRFGDDELNCCKFSEVKEILDARFHRRIPDARSASAVLEPRGNPVNQHSQHMPDVYKCLLGA